MASPSADQRQRGQDGEQVEGPTAQVPALLPGPPPGCGAAAGGGAVRPVISILAPPSGHCAASVGVARAEQHRRAAAARPVPSVMASTAAAAAGGSPTVPTAAARSAPGGTDNVPPGTLIVAPVQRSTTRNDQVTVCGSGVGTSRTRTRTVQGEPGVHAPSSA